MDLLEPTNLESSWSDDMCCERDSGNFRTFRKLWNFLKKFVKFEKRVRNFFSFTRIFPFHWKTFKPNETFRGRHADYRTHSCWDFKKILHFHTLPRVTLYELFTFHFSSTRVLAFLQMLICMDLTWMNYNDEWMTEFDQNWRDIFFAGQSLDGPD